eukprot:scaffold5896_cov155-Amphora_coffeaeformis.AAC.6
MANECAHVKITLCCCDVLTKDLSFLTRVGRSRDAHPPSSCAQKRRERRCAWWYVDSETSFRTADGRNVFEAVVVGRLLSRRPITQHLLLPLALFNNIPIAIIP